MPAATAAPAPRPNAAQSGIRNGWLRAAVVLAGSALCACIALPALPFQETWRGTAASVASQAVNPVSAVLAIAIMLVVCTVVACAVGKMVNAAVGLFVLGCGVALFSMRTGNVLDAAFAGGSLRAIALESLVWAGAVAAMSMAVFRVSGPLPDIPAMNPKGSFAGEVFNGDSARSLLVGLLSVGVVWLVMRNDLKGQSFGCAVAAGIAAAILGRKFMGQAQPILLIAAPVLLIALAQLATSLMSSAPLDQLVINHTLPGWSRMMPSDIAAGALIGVPVGLGWSRTSTDE